jgi:3-hydroxyisobutyrate dehydrogenase
VTSPAESPATTVQKSPTAAVLGTGVMGSAMARNAAEAGMAVRAWSMPLTDAQRLSRHGIEVCGSSAAAVRGADLVVTMVPDAIAIESFATGPDGFLPAMSPDSVWIQTSTVGVGPADRLIELAARHGVTIVDAPVLGSKEPAERGELVMLASGPAAALARCEPFFSAVSRRVMNLGSAGSGSRLKMVTNSWIVSSVTAVAESMALAQALGLDGRRFLEAIAGSPMDMGYAHIKGEMIHNGRYPVQMSLANGSKDAGLAVQAAHEHGLSAPLATAAADLMHAACELGHAGQDMAAVFFAAAADDLHGTRADRRTSPPPPRSPRPPPSASSIPTTKEPSP